MVKWYADKVYVFSVLYFHNVFPLKITTHEIISLQLVRGLESNRFWIQLSLQSHFLLLVPRIPLQEIIPLRDCQGVLNFHSFSYRANSRNKTSSPKRKILAGQPWDIRSKSLVWPSKSLKKSECSAQTSRVDMHDKTSIWKTLGCVFVPFNCFRIYRCPQTTYIHKCGIRPVCRLHCGNTFLVDVSDIFIFFCSGEGKGESGAAGRGGEGQFVFKIPGGGGGGPRRGWEGRVSAGNLGELGGGGLNIFFRGRNVHQAFHFCPIL